MNFKTLLSTAALCVPLALVAQDGYLIKGQVTGLKTPAKAILVYKVKGERVFDSTEVRKGAFTFKGKVGAPKEAHIRLKRADEDEQENNPVVRHQPDVLAFFIEDKVIKITARDSIHNATITGSPTNDDNAIVNAMLKPLYGKYDELNAEFKSQPLSKQKDSAYLASLDQRAEAAKAVILAAKMKYVKENPSKYMALMAYNSTLPPDFDAFAAEKVFATFDEKLKKSDLGEDLFARIQKIKITQEGAPAPDFTQNDVNGKPVKLSDFKGKWVLLDFWASWCNPCRRENPNLVKNYAAYKDKNFVILGVSLDKPADKDKWLAAIEKDNLTWPQVSDLKAWDNEAAKLYDVKAIPMNFLINPEGKIVAKYLRGKELDDKLKQLIK